MDANAKKKAVNSGEISISEKKISNGSEVVIKIASEESPSVSTEKVTNGFESNSVPPVSCPSPEPEGARFTRSHTKPPKIPTTNDAVLIRRRSLARSVYSKPKSRFGEPSYNDPNMIVEDDDSALSEQLGGNSLSRTSCNTSKRSISSSRTNSIATKMSSIASDDEEEIYNKVELIKEKRKRMTPMDLIQWVAFLCNVGCLIVSLTVNKWENFMIWGLEIWKWCVLVLVIFCGMLVTNWFMHVIVFVIETNFLLRKKVLYFVHGLKKSVQVFIWLALVLVTWVLLFNHGVKRSEVATKVLHYITWTLVAFLIGAFLWLLKTLSLKILASNFHVNRFFDRIQESVFHQYVLQTLSGPPLIEEDERVGRAPSFGQLSIRSNKKGKEAKETKIIDMGKVHKMKQEKVSTWTMKLLVDAIMNSRLSTISNTLDESVNEGEHADMEITNEMEAKAAAYYIFRNVAQHGSKYIEEEDLLRFMIKEEVDLVFPLIEGWENGRIDKKALTNWVLKVYKDRKALGHALDDTKTAVKQLNKLVTGILIVVTILVWLLLSEIATTKVIVVLSTQLVAATFMIGHTCKTIFEAVIFVFVMHPFDVGDLCVVDGIPLLVEEMNILTTIFLKLDNEKISYPNSVLATKSISNYNRSPDMGDTVEFSIAFVTPVERIAMLKEKIKQYLENTPQHWHPEHSVVVKEIENVNKIKFALYCNHTMNFQEFGEKNRRRTELMIELKRIFEELNIEYNLLPQKVHLGNPGMQSTILTGK
ncbi:Mechanosensitive ion channel protein 10 [Citrus sinensis]|uniref:Mechanosensitive ion channel protein 10 n=3 Tax=Citrus TaxID=2706 RepID=A0ACB8P3N8_CITSI|nr:mechanosensitive ion channel protein 10 [Citrus x clementina]XP_024033963.1 mechanosensitive ion channel protein 10 [Citrus x clementina]KAH9805112.1 Mechanosensitive ion channel protein 10 [Citrus sinensis]